MEVKMLWLIPLGCLVLWMILTAIEKPKQVIVINEPQPDLKELGKEVDELNDLITQAKKKLMENKQ